MLAALASRPMGRTPALRCCGNWVLRYLLLLHPLCLSILAGCGPIMAARLVPPRIILLVAAIVFLAALGGFVATSPPGAPEAVKTVVVHVVVVEPVCTKYSAPAIVLALGNVTGQEMALGLANAYYSNIHLYDGFAVADCPRSWVYGV